MWLLLAAMMPLVSGQLSPTSDDYVDVSLINADIWKLLVGDQGADIRGWKFSRCASKQCTNYPINITNIVISPDKPRIPGTIFLHVTMDVKEDILLDKIDMDLEIRKSKTNRDGNKEWELIPCYGFDILDGCDGAGSCPYCNVQKNCNESVRGAVKHLKDRNIFMNTKDHTRIQNNNLCPPPKGKWTMTFSREFTSTTYSINSIIFQFLASNEYWFTFNFVGGNNKKLGCARLWIDLCKYYRNDEQKKCIKEGINQKACKIYP